MSLDIFFRTRDDYMGSVAKKRFIVKKMPVKIEMCNFRAEKTAEKQEKLQNGYIDG